MPPENILVTILLNTLPNSMSCSTTLIRHVTPSCVPSMSAGPRYFCKTCNIWISNHPSNIAKHEISDLHKASVNRKIREADEGKKKDLKDEKDVLKQLERINKAAEAAMSRDGIAIGSSRSAHPLHNDLEVTHHKPQKECDWFACRTEEGKLYYANRVTCVTQWDKPVELGGGVRPPNPEPASTTAAGTASIQAAAPPRPVSAAPPPRPKAAVPKRPTQAPTKPAGNAALLTSLLVEETEAPRTDPSTGFGEWESVPMPTEPELPTHLPVATGDAVPHELILEEKKRRPIIFSNAHNDNDAQPVKTGFTRVMTKKPKRTVGLD